MQISLTTPVRIIINIFKYTLGVFAWLVIFTLLNVYCIFNFDSFVNSLWMRDINDSFSVNLLGELAYRAPYGYGDFGCGERYLYTVSYYQQAEDTDDADIKPEIRSFDSLLDIATWKFVKQEGIFTYYTDRNYYYRVRHISDGTDISVVPR